MPCGTRLSLFPFTARPISPRFTSRGHSLFSRLDCVSAEMPKLLADVPPRFPHEPSLVSSHLLKDRTGRKRRSAAPLLPEPIPVKAGPA